MQQDGSKAENCRQITIFVTGEHWIKAHCNSILTWRQTLEDVESQAIGNIERLWYVQTLVSSLLALLGERKAWCVSGQKTTKNEATLVSHRKSGLKCWGTQLFFMAFFMEITVTWDSSFSDSPKTGFSTLGKKIKPIWMCGARGIIQE